MRDEMGQCCGATCGAKTRSGAPCKSAPVTGRGRCRMHGGAALQGKEHGPYRHSFYMSCWREGSVAAEGYRAALTDEIAAMMPREGLARAAAEVLAAQARLCAMEDSGANEGALYRFTKLLYEAMRQPARLRCARAAARLATMIEARRVAEEVGADDVEHLRLAAATNAALGAWIEALAQLTRAETLGRHFWHTCLPRRVMAVQAEPTPAENS